MFDQDRVVACPHCGAFAIEVGKLSPFGGAGWTDGGPAGAVEPGRAVRCACGAFYWRCDALPVGFLTRGRPPTLQDLELPMDKLARLRLAVEDPALAAASEERRNAVRALLGKKVGLPEVRELDPGEHAEAIAAGLARSPTEEVALRRLAWQSMNDALRGSPGTDAFMVGILGFLAWIGVAFTVIFELIFGGRPSRSLWLGLLYVTAIAIATPVVVRWWRTLMLRRRHRRIAAAELFRSNLEALMALLDPGRPEQRLILAEAARELGRFEEAIELARSETCRGEDALTALLIAKLAERREASVAPLSRLWSLGIRARAGAGADP